MAIDDGRSFEHPLYHYWENSPGGGIGLTTLDRVLMHSARHSLWFFPMATSCCAIEFMTAAASRVDLDQAGTIIRPTPRHCDVMVIAGTITVKMAPRVKKLWDQMPEPKWAIAMGSCAICGDFYRDIYSVVPGVDVIIPVDVYIPGCPPNADQVMVGLQRLQEKIKLQLEGKFVEKDLRPGTMIYPKIGTHGDARQTAEVAQAQLDGARGLGVGGKEHRVPRPAPVVPEPAADDTPDSGEPS
jgi:NADH-quinone oxidoreductase subunit B